MKTCPQCGKQSSDRARWCIACRHPFDDNAAASLQRPDAPARAEGDAGCPVCKGQSGKGQFKLRMIGASQTYGVPIVMAVRVTKYRQGMVQAVCGRCERWLFQKRWVAWGAGMAAVVALFAAAALFHQVGLGILGGIAAVTMLYGAFYGLVDQLLWGRELERRLGLPPGRYQFPASVGHVLARTLLAPWLMTIVIASVFGMLESLHRVH